MEATLLGTLATLAFVCPGYLVTRLIKAQVPRGPRSDMEIVLESLLYSSPLLVLAVVVAWPSVQRFLQNQPPTYVDIAWLVCAFACEIALAFLIGFTNPVLRVSRWVVRKGWLSLIDAGSLWYGYLHRHADELAERHGAVLGESVLIRTQSGRTLAGKLAFTDLDSHDLVLTDPWEEIQGRWVPLAPPLPWVVESGLLIDGGAIESVLASFARPVQSDQLIPR